MLAKLRWITALVFACAVWTIDAISAFAAAAPGEDQVGLFYRVTHLHPVVYLILFVVFVLSVVNLVFQAYTSPQDKRFAVPTGVKGKTRTRRMDLPDARPPIPASQRGRGPVAARPAPSTAAAPEESISAARPGQPRRPANAPNANPVPPTPLNGVNHPLPFALPSDPYQPQPEGAPEQQPAKKPPSQQFRFTSAVDVPSPEELERRGKEKLVVSGSVKGPDGRGIGAAVVFLTDEAGGRLGQSCRSDPETGEFKVQVNEPGRYFLHCYKRGYLMESGEPPLLPIESGKIEGYSVRMLPEGCLIHGRVNLKENRDGLQIRLAHCTTEGGEPLHSEEMHASGDFRFYGVPFDAQFRLEILDRVGKILAAGEPFHTGRKRDIYFEINIPAARSKPAQGEADPGLVVPSGPEHDSSPKMTESNGLASPEQGQGKPPLL